MCDTWRKEWFEMQNGLRGQVRYPYSGKGDVTVSGKLTKYSHSKHTLAFMAANPPDYRTSYSGSGLPYANSEMAYDNTPSRGSVSVNSDGTFEFSVPYPSGYYSGLGTAYVKPHVQMMLLDRSKNNSVVDVFTIKIGEGVPFRLLSYPPIPDTAPRCSPLFYNTGDVLPVRTQEQILRDSGYPTKNQMPANFWGLKPPQ